MAILRIGAFSKSYAVPASFENERELERLLAENLQLLVADGATPPVVVTQRLFLPDAGRRDLLLLVDVDSVPTVVETRLASSIDSGRELVAQAIDDIAAVTQLTVEQLNVAASGAVERALWTFAGDDSQDFFRRWTSLAMNLSAARVRLIVAVDELRPPFDRRIRFLAEHSNLDVRCVAVAKSREPNGDTYYAPTIVLDTVNHLRRPRASTNVMQPERRAARDAFNRATGPARLQLVGAVAFGCSVESPTVDLARVQWDG